MTNNFTSYKIDFLNHIDKNLSIDKSQKFFYLKIYNWKISHITLFLNKIKDNEIYTVFPFITTSGLQDDPYLRLSDHFLVTNKSNPELISNFLNDQWSKTDFTTENGILYFKIKRIWYNDENIIYLKSNFIVEFYCNMVFADFKKSNLGSIPRTLGKYNINYM